MPRQMPQWEPIRRILPLAALLLSLVLTGPASADTDAACPAHVVKRGDTLRLIARRYLGTRDLSDTIYHLNRDRIGGNPDLIEPGMRLRLPCPTRTDSPDTLPPTSTAAGPDGPAPAAQAGGAGPTGDAVVETSAARPAPGAGSVAGIAPLTSGREGGVATAPSDQAAATAEAAQVSAVEDTSSITPSATAQDGSASEVFVLTGAPYLPFVDPQDSGGGLIPELVLAAFAETEGPPLRISFVNDRAAHLDVILPRGGFAFSFPWLLPDCTSGRLTRQQGALCTKFIVSDSVYEHVTEFYTVADSAFANARTAAELAGAVICRPSGHPVDDLVVWGLLPDAAEMLREPSPQACIEALDTGRADVATLDGAVARALVTVTAPEHPIVVLESLTHIGSMHAVAPQGDADARRQIDRLNAGLAILVETGLWYEIVNKHLTRIAPQG